MNYPCPCCGYRTFSGPPGTEDVCPICGWHDDLMQLRFPEFSGNPNGVSLVDAQMNYALLGAKDAKTLKSVRFARPDDVRDPEWRPIDTDVDDLQAVPADFDGLTEPEDTTSLYYWLPTVSS